MILLENPVLLATITIIVLCIALYLAVLLFLKKRNGKRLSNEISSLSETTAELVAKLKELNLELDSRRAELSHLIALEARESELHETVRVANAKSEELKSIVEKLEADKTELEDSIQSIKEDISIFQPVLDIVNVGFYEEPEYLFETGERFKAEIKKIREEQKEKIKSGQALIIPSSVAFTDDKAYSKRILTGQGRLLLKAFNIECDNLMAIVKPSNYAKILERIDKAATDLEKSVVSLKCGFSKEYIELKFKECELQYQYKLKDAREKEEQAAIKEQIREEQKAIREFERALAQAQKEEQMYKDALEVARKEFEASSEVDKDALSERIRLLEQQLIEAEAKEERAKSMAEQTRRGHVYIISNIGSFGNDIYKIGLTRRLDPLDRVKELGDASVPFSFDVKGEG